MTESDSMSVSATDVAPLTAVLPDAPVDLSTGFAAGDTAPATVFLIHGHYEEVPDLDPETGQLSETVTVRIEKAYPTDKVALSIGADERGNVLVAEGTVISDEAAAVIAAR